MNNIMKTSNEEYNEEIEEGIYDDNDGTLDGVQILVI